MQRIEPHIYISEVPFNIDDDKREVAQWQNPSNVIHYSAMKHEDGCHRMIFDLIKRNAAPYDDGLMKVYVSIFSDILTNYSTSKFNEEEINRISKGHHYNFYLISEALAMRLNGELPSIDIAGTSFVIDWYQQLLRESGKPGNRLYFEDMTPHASHGALYPYTGALSFFYNPDKHTAIRPITHGKPSRLPSNALWVELPDAFHMDAIGAARRAGLPDMFYLHDYPVQNDLKAIVKPITEMQVRELYTDYYQRIKEKENELKNNGRKRLKLNH